MFPKVMLVGSVLLTCWPGPGPYKAHNVCYQSHFFAMHFLIESAVWT